MKNLSQKLQNSPRLRAIGSILAILILMGCYYSQGQILLRAINLKIRFAESTYSEQIALEVLYCLIFVLLVAMALIVYFLVSQKKPQVTFQRAKIKITVILYAVSLGVQLLLSAINQRISGESQTANNQQIIDIAGLRSDFAFVILFTAVFLSPLFEEIIYRGLIISGIFDRHQLLGVLVQAILFGSAHQVANIWQFLIYFFTGYFFGLIYWRTQDLKYSMIGHFIQNVLGSIEIIQLLLT